MTKRLKTECLLCRWRMRSWNTSCGRRCSSTDLLTWRQPPVSCCPPKPSTSSWRTRRPRSPTNRVSKTLLYICNDSILISSSNIFSCSVLMQHRCWTVICCFSYISVLLFCVLQIYSLLIYSIRFYCILYSVPFFSVIQFYLLSYLIKYTMLFSSSHIYISIFFF